MPEEEQSTETQATPSFRESLRETLGSMSEPESEAASAPETVEANVAEPDEAAVTEPEGSPSVEAAGEPAAPEADEAPETEAITAPETWSQPDRELFSALDAQAQQSMLNLWKNMEAGTTRKMQEAAELRNKYRAVDVVLGELASQFGVQDRNALVEAFNNTLPDVMRQYIAFQRDPVGTLVALADQSNVTNDVVDRLSELDINEDARRTRAENQQLKARQAAERQQQMLAQVSEAEQVLEAFREQRDEAGSLKYPRFEANRQMMARLMNDQPNLEMAEAYEQADWALHREERLAEHEAKLRTEQTLTAQDRRKRAKPKPAPSSGVAPAPTEKVPAKLRDHLKQEARAQMERQAGG